MAPVIQTLDAFCCGPWFETGCTIGLLAPVVLAVLTNALDARRHARGIGGGR